MTALRVKTFRDQDECRVVISDIASRAAADILYLLDSATGPEGSESFDPSPDPETAKLYKEFREWFGPQVAQTIMGLVVGPVLSRLSVFADGSVNVESQAYRHFLSSDDRLSARLKWLCEEIPSLITTYNQLLDDEPQEAMSLVEAALELDMGEAEDRKAARMLLPDLEKWFLYSNPGALIFRGHEETIDELLSSMDSMRERIKEIESERSHALKSLKSGNHASKDERYIQDELNKVEQNIVKLENRLISLERQRGSLIEALS